jgi:hypothetical protein
MNSIKSRNLLAVTLRPSASGKSFEPFEIRDLCDGFDGRRAG